SGHGQAFLVRQTNGVWGAAVEAPGTATLNSGGDASVNSLSCPTAGNCAAGGWDRDGSGHLQAVVASLKNGVWAAAAQVPGTAALNSGGSAYVRSLSCPPAGSCAPAGQYKDGSGHRQAFVVSETNGVWGTAIEVPGTATLNTGG